MDTTQEIKIIFRNNSNTYPLFEDKANGLYVNAKFIRWDKFDYITHISVTSNFLNIKKVFFCAVENTLEIRGISGTTDEQPYIEEMPSFKIKEEKVIILDYTDEGKVDENDICIYKGKNQVPIQPETLNGNVILGS